MEKIIKDAMNDDVLKQAATLYEVAFEDIKHLGGFENHVYEFSKNNSNYILRFVHDSHRIYDYVLGELEFIDYLDQNGASVSTVVHSVNNQLVEKLMLQDGHYFTLCVFKKAPGTFVKKDEMTDEFFYKFGKEVGKLHRLSKTFNPKYKRYEWYEEDYINKCKSYIPENEQIIIEKANELYKKIKSLPQNTDNYGLIHTDLHFHNMFYHEGKLTFFDFDDASYKHFISDIAIIIFYYILTNPDVNRVKSTKHILTHFLKGYKEENTIEMKMFKYFNDFLKLREIILYLVMMASGFSKTDDEKRLAKLHKHRDRIISDVPFLESLEFIDEL